MQTQAFRHLEGLVNKARNGDDKIWARIDQTFEWIICEGTLEDLDSSLRLVEGPLLDFAESSEKR